MMQQHNLLQPPQWRIRAAGARATLSRAAARLRRTLFGKKNNKTSSDHPTLAEYLAQVSELKAETMAKEVKNCDTAITVEAEDECRTGQEEVDQLSDQIKYFKEAFLTAEVESLREERDLTMLKLVEERKEVERLRQVKEDLLAALQRAQSDQTVADSLRTVFQRKLSVESKLIQKNVHPEDAVRDQLPLSTDSPQTPSNGAMSSFQKTNNKRAHTFLENFKTGSTKIRASFDEIRTQFNRSNYSGDSLSPSESTQISFSDKLSGISIRRIEFLLDPLPNTLTIKGAVVKNNSVAWFVEIKKEIQVLSRQNSAAPKRQRLQPQGAYLRIHRSLPRPGSSNLAPVPSIK